MKNLLIILSLIFSIAYADDYWTAIITGSRMKQNYADQASPIDLLTSQELQSMGVASVGEALRSLPALHLTSQGSVGQLSTLTLYGISSNKILVLLDGHPINPLSVGSVDLNQIPLAIVERIEIIKNSTSSLWGENAVGGVVHIITKNPEPGLKISPAIGYGPNGEQAYNLQTSLAGFGQGVIFNFNNLIGSGFRDNSDYDQRNYYLKTSLWLTPAINFKVFGNFLRNETGVAGAKPAAGSLPTYGSADSASLYDRQLDQNLDLEANIDIYQSESSIFHLRTYQDQNDLTYAYVYDSSGRVDETAYTFSRSTGESVSWEGRTGLASMVVGMDNRFDEVESHTDSLSGSTLTTTSWIGNGNVQGYWGGVNLGFGLVNLDLSMRKDQHSTYGENISPKAGLVIQLNPTLAFKGTTGTAYKAPTYSDLFYSDAWMSGNPNLVPERSWNGDLSLEFNPRAQERYKLILFQRNVQDMIQWAPDASGSWTPQNINQVSITGAELNWEQELLPNVQWQNGLTYTQATQTNQEVTDYISNATTETTRRLAYVPRIKANTQLTVGDGSGLQASLLGRYLTSRVNYYTSYGSWPDTSVSYTEKILSPAMIWDVNLNWQASEITHVQFAIRNMFDETYADQFGSDLTDQNYPSAGRSYTCTLRMDLI